MAKMDTKSAVVMSLSILIGLIWGTFISYLRYPQQESLNCSKNYKCNIERKYFGIFKSNKEFIITKNVLYLPIYKEHWTFDIIRTVIDYQIDGLEYHHHYSDNKNLNIKFKNYIRGINEYQLKTNEINKFEKYKENPNIIDYYVSISLNIEDRKNDILAMSVISSIILMIIIFPLAYYKE